ncbi:MAG: hypothetical protein DRQ52_10805 [Gammaproteobacteria bacterium]|nr:MAG: hypothetical protein DRQ52_10805 [Gammaproteobacteria bacterium]
MNGLLMAAALTVTSNNNFETTVEEMRTEQSVPGVSAVVTLGDKILYAGASGVADINTDRPMTVNTVVYAGSLSKVFTSTLILQLVEQNKLSLNDPVSEIAIQPGDNSPEITVAHLLTHAGGLEREGDFGYWFSGEFPDRAALSRYLLSAELREPPGRSLHYSNVGYAKLGLIVEAVEGRPYHDVLRSELLEPLGMASSGAPGPIEGIARGYTPVGRLIPDQQRPFTGVGRAVDDRHLREYHDAKAMTPAFGIYASALDLSRLTRFLLGHGGDEVLSTTMRERMRSRQPSGWGLGLKLGTLDGRSVARHEGWFAAHRSHMLLDFKADISIVVMTNSDSGKPAEIAEALHKLVLNAGLN